MNKNNNTAILLSSLALALPILYITNSHANGPLTYIDASGNTKVIGGDNQPVTPPQES